VIYKHVYHATRMIERILLQIWFNWFRWLCQ